MADLAVPADVAQGLATFVDATQAALGPDLVAVVLFGSAAEGRLRATSDVNVIVVAQRFAPDRLNALRDAGLDRATQDGLLQIDRDGLVLAARSMQAKRAAHARPPLRAGWKARLLSWPRLGAD
jgi:hypothetical protein